MSRAAQPGANSATQFSIAAAGAISALVEWLVDPSLGPPQMAARALADLARDSPDVQVSATDGTSDEP